VLGVTVSRKDLGSDDRSAKFKSTHNRSESEKQNIREVLPAVISVLICSRVILFQIVPSLVLFATVSMTLASFPLFIFNDFLIETLPALIIYGAINREMAIEKELQSFVALHPETKEVLSEIDTIKVLSEEYSWRLYLRGTILFWNESRLLQFIQSSLTLFFSFLLLIYTRDLLVYLIVILGILFLFILSKSLVFLLYLGSSLDLKDADFPQWLFGLRKQKNSMIKVTPITGEKDEIILQEMGLPTQTVPAEETQEQENSCQVVEDEPDSVSDNDHTYNPEFLEEQEMVHEMKWFSVTSVTLPVKPFGRRRSSLSTKLRQTHFYSEEDKAEEESELSSLDFDEMNFSEIATASSPPRSSHSTSFNVLDNQEMFREFELIPMELTNDGTSVKPPGRRRSSLSTKLRHFGFYSEVDETESEKPSLEFEDVDFSEIASASSRPSSSSHSSANSVKERKDSSALSSSENLSTANQTSSKEKHWSYLSSNGSVGMLLRSAGLRKLFAQKEANVSDSESSESVEHRQSKKEEDLESGFDVEANKAKCEGSVHDDEKEGTNEPNKSVEGCRGRRLEATTIHVTLGQEDLESGFPLSISEDENGQLSHNEKCENEPSLINEYRQIESSRMFSEQGHLESGFAFTKDEEEGERSPRDDDQDKKENDNEISEMDEYHRNGSPAARIHFPFEQEFLESGITSTKREDDECERSPDHYQPNHNNNDVSQNDEYQQKESFENIPLPLERGEDLESGIALENTKKITVEPERNPDEGDENEELGINEARERDAEDCGEISLAAATISHVSLEQLDLESGFASSKSNEDERTTPPEGEESDNNKSAEIDGYRRNESLGSIIHFHPEQEDLESGLAYEEKTAEFERSPHDNEVSDSDSSESDDEHCHREEGFGDVSEFLEKEGDLESGLSLK
jgi:hypothetical protein